MSIKILALNEIVKEGYIRLMLEEIVVELLLLELSQIEKLCLRCLIQVLVTDLRNYLYHTLEEQFFTLKALKKSLKVKTVLTISETPADPRCPPALRLPPFFVCQYSGDLRITFFK
jgi:hypothetical protein